MPHPDIGPILPPQLICHIRLIHMVVVFVYDVKSLIAHGSHWIWLSMIDMPFFNDPFNALRHHWENMYRFIIINTDSKEIRRILQIDQPSCRCGPFQSLCFFAFNLIGWLMPSVIPLPVGQHTPCPNNREKFLWVEQVVHVHMRQHIWQPLHKPNNMLCGIRQLEMIVLLSSLGASLCWNKNEKV